MQAGDLISGKYRLLRQLGSGGMGSVWAARNELTDRDFAIKFLLPDLATNKEALQRFFLEARACGQIKHPAVVDVYDMGQAEDLSPYLVMELMEGEGFDQRLARSGTFRPAEAAAWIAFVARGLEEAHVRGLVHRDLKPGNIFFALDGRGEIIPKLLDFGVSKATGPRTGEDFVKTTTGAVLGSPAYMSPEQAKGEADIDGRSDVWSLGVIMYEALTGEIPFDAPNYNALMLTIITKDHRRLLQLAPGVPKELSEIVDHALAKDRTQRIGTAREFADRLEAVVAKITNSPLPRYHPKGSPQPSRGAGASAGRQYSTTEGTWSGRKAAPFASRAPLVWITATLLLATVATASVIAFVRLRAPMVAVAGRSELALSTGLARVRQRVEQIKAEAAAPAKPAPSTTAPSHEKVVIQPSELPPAGKSSPAPGRKAQPAPAQSPSTKPSTKKSGPDPHGGVDSAGF